MYIINLSEFSAVCLSVSEHTST